MFELLKRAEIVARLAHEGQYDKGGTPYVEHLKAVAGMLYNEDAKIVAWLHDTIEDTPLSQHDLIELGFPKYIVKAVALLTHTHEHTHDDYLRVLRDAPGREGQLARKVKRADLAHNADATRSQHMPLHALEKRYQRSMNILNKAE